MTSAIWLAACDGGSAQDQEPAPAVQTAAASSSPSASLSYVYTALASYPRNGLTATTVKDGIDQCAAVAYGALDAADAALVAAKDYSDAGDAAVLQQSIEYSDVHDALTLATANAYSDGASAAALATARSYTDAAVAAAAEPCTPTCQNAMQTVYARDAEGSCVLHFRVPCAPYACDDAGVTCNDSCVSGADCSTGASCDTVNGQCTDGLATCYGAFTVLTADQQLVSCSPYECLNGHCQQQCQDDGSCDEDYHCVSGRCVEN